jgi:signal peptidase I
MLGLVCGILGTSALVALATGVHILRRRIVVVTVVGPSMQPTLAPGDRVLVRRVRTGQVRTGQIVVIEKPDESGTWTTPPLSRSTGQREWMIKRVAAVPRDHRPDAMPANSAGLLVPADKLVVLGDNPVLSLDSRQIGYIPAERVLGVVLSPRM